MNKINQKLTAFSALVLTVGVTTISTPQKADAQVVELATSAVNAIFNRPRKPLANQTYIFGTNNLHSNNVCLLPCAPTSTPSPVAPQPVGQAAPVASQPVGQAAPVTPQTTQPSAPRPVLLVPPIKLPINLPR